MRSEIRSRREEVVKDGGVSEVVRDNHPEEQMGSPEEETSQIATAPVMSPEVEVAETSALSGRPRRTLHKPKFLSEYVLE